jgi:hypothetical protein
MHIYTDAYLLCQLFLAGVERLSYDYHHALQQTLRDRSIRHAKHH